MKYDIATKVLMDTCRDEIIRQFLGIEVMESSLIEVLPQETVSLKRSDYPILVTDNKGVTRLAIVEIQTAWNRNVPLNLLDYRTRYLIRQNIEAVSCVILLRPSASATDHYSDTEVSFRYRLIRIYEMDAQKVVSDGLICLMPFVPLMQHGKELLEEADALIYNSGKTRLEKADMLTSMAILSGIVSKELPLYLLSRRRDIMIESAGYDLIKNEGFREGKQEGMLQGIQVGREEGILQTFAETLIVLLEVKFGIDGIALYQKMKDIKDISKIKAIMEVIRLSKTPEDVLKFVEA